MVQRFGDTTDANAQLRALAHFGITARIAQNADFHLLEQQIDRGIPVPWGYIHRGPVDRSTGSGHWLTVYGHTPTHVVVNDPWGEPYLIHGNTLNASGMGLRFSRLNFGKRWMVAPTGMHRTGGGRWRWIEWAEHPVHCLVLLSRSTLGSLRRLAVIAPARYGESQAFRPPGGLCWRRACCISRAVRDRRQ